MKKSLRKYVFLRTTILSVSCTVLTLSVSIFLEYRDFNKAVEQTGAPLLAERSPHVDSDGTDVIDDRVLRLETEMNRKIVRQIILFGILLSALVSGAFFVSQRPADYVVTIVDFLLSLFSPEKEGEARIDPKLQNCVEFEALAEARNRLVERREATEQALRQSQERYREIVEGTDNLVTEVDTEGRFVFVNEASRNIFGMEPKECVGRMAFDFIHPDDKEMTRRHFNRWITEKAPRVTFENRQLNKTGESRDMLWSINFHYDEQQNVTSIKSIARDITDRKNAEKSAQRSNARFQSIFRSEIIGIVLADFKGRIVEANDTFLKMSGYERTCFPLDYTEMTPAEAKEQDREMIRQIRNRGIAPAFEKKIVCADGMLLPVMIAGVQLKEEKEKVLLFILDQREKAKAVEELKRSEEKLASIFRAAPVGIGVVNDRIITYSNERLSAITGYAQEALMQKSSRMLYPNDEEFDRVGRDKYKQISQVGTGTVETIWKKADGKILHVLLSSTPLDTTDLSQGVIFTALDITDRKETEVELARYRNSLEELVEERTAELKRANAQLQVEIAERRKVEEELQRYADAQGVLVREVNHRVKNNLSAIIGMLHMESDRANAEGMSTYLPVLRDLVNRIEGLSTVHSLLSASGWRPLEVSELSRQVVGAVLQGVPLGKQVETRIRESQVRINSNQAHHLTLVINELATNTVKYAIDDKDRTIITIDVADNDKTVEIRYKDNGPGYPDRILGDPSSTGSIGFELIRGITGRSLNGDVTFANDRGAVARIVFPNELDSRP